ncbi:MAG: peptidyl-prolyl cis-trans isomerase [Cyanobacteriota bacterium erpe_2018_sw_21hr_WHONDRS-SW48-000092_B_bin.40]|jgi:peptidyl-prolyl cis-trans isomerase B (cyclophilin B)|nr:peptidyl-prolyl cis-trans isomerase [Cyanobacteriota bacterium erpe_2018_sw_21hr_WHONDRS-SW48-000092_B_bin.40]
MALVNQFAIPRKMQLSSLALVLLLSGTATAALADQTDPDFVPPEITLPMPARYNPAVTPAASSPNLGNTPAPGMTNMGANMGAGAIPGMNNPNQPNPFMMKASDRLRLPPGTSVPGRGSGPPGAAGANPGYPGQQMAAPPQGSSAFLQPGQQPPGAGTPLQKQLAAQGQNNQGNQNNQGGQTDPVVTLQTNKGTIVMRLFRQHAPTTVKAFLQMVKSGFYNGLTFHRVEPGFVVQGGCPNGNGTGDYIPPGQTQPRYLPLEVSPFARHNAAGVVAMARKPNNRDSSSCQFYITLGPKQQLDNQYTVFGGVIQGLDVVQRIAIGDRILAMTASE